MCSRAGRLKGVSTSSQFTPLGLKGYPKSHKMRYDPVNGVINTVCIVEIREKAVAPETGMWTLDEPSI
jgi:hypothetical protein